MYDCSWLIIWICDKLDKFQSFIFWELVCKECIDKVLNWLRGIQKEWWELRSGARSAHSQGATKCRRTRTEKYKECGKSFFRRNPSIWVCWDPQNARSAWEIKILKGINLRRDSEEKYSKWVKLWRYHELSIKDPSRRDQDRSRSLDLGKLHEL